MPLLKRRQLWCFKKSTAVILGHSGDIALFSPSTFPCVTNQHGHQCEVTAEDTHTPIRAVIITNWLWLLQNSTGRLQERSVNSVAVRCVIYSYNQAQSCRTKTVFFFLSNHAAHCFTFRGSFLEGKKQSFDKLHPDSHCQSAAQKPQSSKLVERGPWGGALDLLRCPQGCFFLSDFIAWRRINTRRIYVSRIVISVKLCTLRSPK